MIFVASSMFQAMGNTIPPLVDLVRPDRRAGVPVILISRLPGFQLWWIWYLSVAAVWLHLGANLILLRREFRRRLAFRRSLIASVSRRSPSSAARVDARARSFQFNRVLNTMLNSPWFCQR